MKKIIINEQSLRNNRAKLLENKIMDLKLPSFLFKQLKLHKTSVGENEAFPPDDVYPFDYRIIKQRFYDVTQAISTLEDIESLDVDYLVSELSTSIKRCKEIEKPIRNNLTKLCQNVIAKLFVIPDETVNFECQLVDKIETDEAIRVFPEDSDNRNFDFADLNDFGNADKAIYKRRLINALIQGASYTYSTLYDLYMDEIKVLNDELPYLYHKIILLNNYLLFVKKETITNDKPMQGGYVEVLLGNNGERSQIKAQGYIFPFLLNETIRGFFELFASHGLPDDKNKAKYILSQADFVYAEPWDMRIGVGLWDILASNIEDTTILPYFFSSLCKMKIENFNQALKEIFAKTIKGKNLLQTFIDKSTHAKELHDFSSVIQQKNAIHTIINDNYISAEELDTFILDNDSDDVITENEGNDIIFSPQFKAWFGDWENNPKKCSKAVDENGLPLIMHHATDIEVFDTFNHDKIGGSGAGCYHGYGFNFSSWESHQYGKNIIKTYLRCFKPLTNKKKSISPQKIVNMMIALDKISGESIACDFTGYYIPQDGRNYINNIYKAAKQLYENASDDIDVYSSLSLASNCKPIDVIHLFEKYGYDSVIEYSRVNPKRPSIIVVFEPNQIKSISNTNFNLDNNSINESYFPSTYKDMDDVIRLYHGTTLEGMEGIIESGTISAIDGRQHGETRGVNWFSTKLTGNFGTGNYFSIGVPKSEFENGNFHFMNDGEVTSWHDQIDISKYDFRIEILDRMTPEVMENIYKMKNGDIWGMQEFFMKYKNIDLNDKVLQMYFIQLFGEKPLKNEGFIE